MVEIKIPATYINEPGAIKKAGAYLKGLGKKRILLIAGPHTLAAVEEKFARSLQEGQSYTKEIFQGYPTKALAEQYAALAKEYQADIFVAAGGGRAMDVTKAAADIAKLPVFTIPTVIGTCAAWAACSVLYDDKGDFREVRYNRQSPVFVLADTEIIAHSPVRYAKSGIADTYAKWYELHPVSRQNQQNLTLAITEYGAEKARDILEKESGEALTAMEQGQVNQPLQDIIDSVIYLAGYSSSITGGEGRVAFPHQFYNSIRGVKESQARYHGELVAYGMLVQMVLNGESPVDIRRLAQRLGQVDNLFSLAEIGLAEEENRNFVANRIVDEYQPLTIPAEKHNVPDIVQAITEAESYVKETY